MSEQKRYTLVGTGSRAGMYVRALSGDFADVSQLVALCDLSQTRMDYYNRMIVGEFGRDAVPTYHADDFDRMVAEQKPHTVIVSTMDATHHIYINRAMELGCDVIVEKPMTTDEDKAQGILDTVERTGRDLRVSFNYRYNPIFTQFKEVLVTGAIGRPLSVDFTWLLDVRHGADYFRRWHREKKNSGGLMVHKSTHHFDLVNWWVESFPVEVSAMGNLQFYGKKNAAARGKTYDYDRYTGVPQAKDDPFAVFLDQSPKLKGLYLDAEAETGYIRDRNVFGEPITAEDAVSVSARYHNGVLLHYMLVAYSPWEGLRVAINGTEGRAEMDLVITVELEKKDAESVEDIDTTASTGAYRLHSMRVFRHFEEGYAIPVGLNRNKGGHGGADPVMLNDMFGANPPADPLNRAASHIDGAASILLGICANKSMADHRWVRVEDVLPLEARLLAK